MAEINKKNFVKNNIKKNTDKKQKRNFIKKQNIKFADEKTAKFYYPKDSYIGKQYIEYKMPKEIIIDLLNNRNKDEEKVDPELYLCNYVNEQLKLLGYCIRVIEG